MAKKVVCYHFSDAGRRTQDSWVRDKDVLIHNTARCLRISIFASVSLTPKSPEGEVGADDKGNKVDLIAEELWAWGNLAIVWAGSLSCHSGRYTSSSRVFYAKRQSQNWRSWALNLWLVKQQQKTEWPVENCLPNTIEKVKLIKIEVCFYHNSDHGPAIFSLASIFSFLHCLMHL